MNKFKKILLGVASVLTLGALFTVSSVKVNAEATSFYTASMTGEEGAATTFSAGDEIVSDSNLKLEIIGCTATESARSLSTYTVALASGGNGSDSKYFKFTSLSTSDMNVTVYFADYNSDGTKMQAKSYTFGTKTGTTTKALNSETDKLDSKENIMLYSAGRCNLFKVEYEIIEVDESVYTATFVLNGGSGTAPTDITVSVDADDKTITLPTTTATKAKYSFEGWSDGTNTYEAGSSYTLSSNVEFEAVWALSVAYGDNLVLNASNLNVGNEDNIIDGSIYCFTSALTIDANNKSIDGYSFTKRIKLSGAGTKTSTSILVKAPSAGTLKVYGMSGSKGSSRILGLYDSEYAAVDVTGFENDGNEISSYEYNIPSAGDYYLGSVASGFNVYYVEFVATPEVEVTPLVQEATDTDYTYVRFVTIVSNAGEISSDDVEFSITMTYTNETTKTVSYTPYVVKKITQNGEAYVANVGTESHTFDNALNATEYYVVYVIRFTTSKFTGCKVSATTTFAGQEYTSSQVTI